MFFAFSPFAISRACVAVRKLRVILSWQVAQLSDPTNSAPGMLGGARIVRFVVLQESRITASAAVPPTPHKIFSRLPWIHRVGLEYHTNTKCCQKLGNSTTHFYGKYSADFGRVYRNSATSSSISTRSAILRRRFLGQPLENTIELRQRLKSHGERNFTNAQIRIPQEIASFFESGSCDVFHKICASDLLEFFAEMIPANVGCFRYLGERKFFGRMFLNELSRFPDLYRFGAMAIALRESICGCCYHRTLSSHSWRR